MQASGPFRSGIAYSVATFTDLRSTADVLAMRLTTRGRYAVTAMLDIALHREAGPVSVADVAGRQGISSSYLEQLFGKLRRADLIESLRGPGGGYRLKGDAEWINISDIIEAVEEDVDATRCHGTADCQEGLTCLTHDLWADLSLEIASYLKGITLASLMARSEIQSIAHRQDRRAEERIAAQAV